MEFNFDEAQFEWDENKARINFSKHGIRFETAVKVFKDPDKLIREDLEHTEELRYNVIGRVNKIFFVVCLLKEENTIRMISARLATKAEKERYMSDEEDFI